MRRASYVAASGGPASPREDPVDLPFRAANKFGDLLSRPVFLGVAGQGEHGALEIPKRADEFGQTAAYGKLNEAMRGFEGLSTAFAVTLVSPQDELVRHIRSAIQTGQSVKTIRLSKNVSNGHYVEDAVIYRST